MAINSEKSSSSTYKTGVVRTEIKFIFHLFFDFIKIYKAFTISIGSPFFLLIAILSDANAPKTSILQQLQFFDYTEKIS